MVLVSLCTTEMTGYVAEEVVHSPSLSVPACVLHLSSFPPQPSLK